MIRIQVPTGALRCFISLHTLPPPAWNHFIAELLPRNWPTSIRYLGAYLLFKRPSCESRWRGPRRRRLSSSSRAEPVFEWLAFQSFTYTFISSVECFCSMGRQLGAEKEQALEDAISTSLNFGFATFWVFTLGKLLEVFKGYPNK